MMRRHDLGGLAMSAIRREDRFFDLMVELCDHAEARKE
jgi:hypothetical protein